jgi:protocatechuate 3,4-dioxygenase beta subunit
LDMSEAGMSSTPQLHTTRSGAVSQHTPHQILGPYFPAIEKPTATSNLTVVNGLQGRAQGEIIEVQGRVLDRNGDAIGGATLVIWQANSFGRYAHPNDSNPAPLDKNFVGSAQLFSGPGGGYRFKTVKPGAYPTGAGRIRPPHIHFEVQGKFDRLITQMYFPGEPLNDCDPLLLSANNPNLLIAQPLVSQTTANYRTFMFDIVLMRG